MISLSLNNSPLPGCTPVCLSTQPTEGDFDCFQVLAVMNKAVIDISGQVLCGCKVFTALGKY